MNRRNLLGSMASLGIVSYFGFDKLFRREHGEIVHCNIEDFWDTVKYKEERINGELQRNVYRIEDYPKCSFYKRISFNQLKKDDFFIIVYSKNDYSGPNNGYGFVSKALSNVFESDNTVGVQLTNINMKQCWAEDAFEKHIILSGGTIIIGDRHYKNGIRIG
jgi:hypothetical protein